MPNPTPFSKLIQGKSRRVIALARAMVRRRWDREAKALSDKAKQDELLLAEARPKAEQEPK